MSDIGHITSHSAGQIFSAESARRGVERAAPGVRDAGAPVGRDRVELSDRALLLSRLRELPAIREDLVQRVRAAIEAGEYETSDQIDRASEGLAHDLDLLADE